jgi:hypothetical protein
MYELFRALYSHGEAEAEKGRMPRWPKQLFYFPFMVHEKSTSSYNSKETTIGET